MTPTLSTDKLEAILAGAAKATPGPWIVRPDQHDDWGYVRGGPPDVDGRQWVVAQARAGRFVNQNEFQQHRNNSTDPYGDNAAHIAACDPDTITSLITAYLASHSTIEDLRRERDEAQSAVTAWQQVFGTIEAHLMDRINMKDEADPQRYLDIIRYDVAHVDEASKRIVASRWFDYREHEKRIAELEVRAEAAERELAIVKEGGWKLVPVEPTDDMVEAFYHAEGPAGPDRIVTWSVATAMARGNVFRHLDDIFGNAYRAMIAAAPLPPAPALNGEQE